MQNNDPILIYFYYIRYNLNFWIFLLYFVIHQFIYLFGFTKKGRSFKKLDWVKGGKRKKCQSGLGSAERTIHFFKLRKETCIYFNF